MMLEIQKFLSKCGYGNEGCDAFLEELGIKHKIETGPDGKRYLHLDYTIKGKKSSKIVKECRGLGLKFNTWEIFRLGFYRFMNYGEGGCDKIDFGREIDYEEKCDGSLIFLHWVNGIGWNVGTRGVLFPNGKINGFDITFPELFWKLFPHESIEKLDQNICYLFELCAIENRVVIQHKTPKIVLIGARDKEWKELDPKSLNHIAKNLNVDRPNSFRFPDLKTALDFVSGFNGGMEGFVLKQWSEPEGRYLRIKVKSEVYVALHNITSVRSLNNLVKIVLKGERSVLENGFEEYLPAYDKIKKVFDEWVAMAEEIYSSNKHFLFDLDKPHGDFKERRKKFAQSVMPTGCGNYCFGRADGKIESAEEFLQADLTSGKIKKLIAQFDLTKVVGSGWKIVDDETEDI